MKLLRFAAAAAFVAASFTTGVARATTIDGALFFGSITFNFYDPAHAEIPPGFDNASSPTIPVPGAFGFNEGGNFDSAAFTSTTLSLTEEAFTDGGADHWRQVFTASTANFFDGIHLVSDSFPNGGVSFSVSGDTLTVTWPGTSDPGTGVADFTFGGGGAVPEPSTWAMIAIAFLCLAGLRARRGVHVRV